MLVIISSVFVSCFWYCFILEMLCFFFFKKLHCEPSEWCFKILGKIFTLVIIFSFLKNLWILFSIRNSYVLFQKVVL